MRSATDAVRITSFLVVGLTALAGAIFVWLQTVSSRSAMERMTKAVAEAVAEAQSRDSRRPVLGGDARPGTAWTEYQQALALMPRGDTTQVRDALARPNPVDQAKVEAFVAAHGKALDLLRAGARKTEGAYPTQWERGARTDVPSLIAVRNLATLAVAQARLLAQTGRPREAGELLADAAQFSTDVGRNTVLIGELTALAALGDVFEGVKRLPPDPDLERTLARLEDILPKHGETQRNELVTMGVSLVQMGDAGALSRNWRFGFSQASMLAETWTTLEAMGRRMAAATTAPWAEARRVHAEIDAEAGASGNPLVQNAITGLLRSERESRAALARLRMLRVLHGRATGLDDPFGSKLLSDGAKVWSVGANGTDDGGVGTWRSDSHLDLVLELPAR